MTDEPQRITVTLIPKANDALVQTAERTGLTRTDVINRALQAYAYLDEQVASGAKIFLRRGNATEEVRFL